MAIITSAKNILLIVTTDNEHIILRANDLSIGYRTKSTETLISSHLNFELKKGQLVGLIGANGIGKSTLLKTLIKAQPILSGTIEIHQKPIDQLSYLDLAKQLSVVLTEPLNTKNLTVFELVALGRQPYTNWLGRLTNADIKATLHAIDLVGISNLKDKRCYELSDGQLQNVMIARALAQDTSLIILDEPTTHLDMYHKAHILTLLKTLTRTTGKTILFSSHEINLAIKLCDYMLVMTNDGFYCDTPNQLIAKDIFQTLFSKDLITFNTKNKSFEVKQSL